MVIQGLILGLGLIAASYLLIVLLAVILYSVCDHQAFCYVGWHKGEIKSFDGCSAHGVCRVCGKAVMQDSQGNWF